MKCPFFGSLLFLVSLTLSLVVGRTVRPDGGLCSPSFFVSFCPDPLPRMGKPKIVFAKNLKEYILLLIILSFVGSMNL